jgi:hypothetical protein
LIKSNNFGRYGHYCGKRTKNLNDRSAFNEEGSVGKVVEEVKTHLPQIDALVLNDGSSDLTSEIANAKGAVVLDLPFNLGIGGAMQSGYKYTFEKGYDIAIQVDGGSEFYSDIEEGC